MPPKTTTTNPTASTAFPFGVAVATKSQYEMTAGEPRRGGSRSCSVLDITVPVILGNGSASLDLLCRMYCEYNPAAGTLTFQAALPKNVKIADDFELARFRHHALIAAQAHPDWEKLAAHAEAVLTGQRIKTEFKKPSKLVKTIGGQRTTVAETLVPVDGTSDSAAASV
jgi:hypothetical protein